MFCLSCGTQLPDGTSFCYKCGTATTPGGGRPAVQPSDAPTASSRKEQIIAPAGASSLKCPSCGAPIAPKFGEMVITCEYCGSGVTLGNQGWTGIQKQSMLALKVSSVDEVNSIIAPMMDKGLLHRHLHEDSTQEEMNLSYIPYWIVSVSARTTVVTVNVAAQMEQTATTAALMGVIMGGMGGGFGRRRTFEEWAGIGTPPLLSSGFLSRRFMAFGMGMGYGRAGMTKTEQIDTNYNFPVVALKALMEYQPRDYQFDLEGRALFDITNLPKNIKILNGDISEDVAKSQAKTLVDQLQSEKAHAKYHMIQQITTQSDVGDLELLYAPIWFAKYDHKGTKIVLVIDANSGRVINSLGL